MFLQMQMEHLPHSPHPTIRGHKLVEAVAESRVAVRARRAGEGGLIKSVEKGVVVGELRRQLSVVNLRASMTCLLDRLEQAGE